MTTTTTQQTINGLTITLASPTNAQATRVTYGFITGYYIGDANLSEEINFSLSKPIRRIKIIGRALSAPDDRVEYFTLKVNGQHHIIQSSELINPDPAYGRLCFLQSNGSIKGDTIGNGDGSFILTYEDIQGITSFQIKDSITSMNPEGAIFDVQIYTKCNNDTAIASNPPKFYIPTAFTPNNDGKNDIFRPLITGELKRYEFRIFNRWGQNIFSSFDTRKGWDGTNNGIPQDTGMFIWICYYQGLRQQLQIRKGTVMLIK